MTDTDLRQRARELVWACHFASYRGEPVSENFPDYFPDGANWKVDEAEAALRAVQQETEQRMLVQRALAWDETAKRIAAIDTLTEERDEYKTLAAIGVWHNDCRPNRHMAARELEKSQIVINKLADEISELHSRFAKLRERVEHLAPGPQSSMGQPTVYLADLLALLPPVELLTQADIARKEEWEGRS